MSDKVKTAVLTDGTCSIQITGHNMNCKHEIVRCLNHYDVFRKYLCENCGEIYICNCERDLALAFLPHQVNFATEYRTRERWEVSGFAPRMCAECRGKVEEPHPKAAIYGRKGKVERFYWREIFKTECELIRDWLRKQGEMVKDILEFRRRFPEASRDFRKQAKLHWQQIHRNNPKYDLRERTEADFLKDIPVPIVEIEAPYTQIHKDGQKIGKWINNSGREVRVEDIAMEWYETKGYSVLRCERNLISSWVGTFLVKAIQHPDDPRQQPRMRHSTRGWRSDNKNTPIITFLLPEDFGSRHYFNRRRDSIERCIQRMDQAQNLSALFERLLGPSELLRDYLWVNEDRHVETTRASLAILPSSLIINSVRWVIQDFWARQPGWPDLLIYRDEDFRFSEVKSPLDCLSQEQMNWFHWAVTESKIPCEIIRIKRKHRRIKK